MKKYIDYLPQYLKNIEELKTIGDAEDSVVKDEEDFFRGIEKAQWIDTSEEAGLSRREKILGIKSYPTDSFAERRAVIKARWNSYYPYTYYSMINWLGSVYGDGKYFVNVEYETYTVSIELVASIKHLLEEVFNEARRMIPANMKLVVSLRYTRHRDINVTYGELASMTHTTIRETTFSKQLNG